jgi:hypothetical protein
MKAMGRLRTDDHQAKILDSVSLSKWRLTITLTFGVNMLYAQVLLVTVTILQKHAILKNVKDNLSQKTEC